MSYSNIVRDRLNKTGQFHPVQLATLEAQRQEAIEAYRQANPLPDIKPKKVHYHVTLALMEMQRQHYLTDQQRVLNDMREAQARKRAEEGTVGKTQEVPYTTVLKSRAVGKSESSIKKLRKEDDESTDPE